MKRLSKFLFVFLFFLINLTFSWNYNFFHWPSLGKVYVKVGKVFGHKYLYYKGDIKQFNFNNVDYSDILNKLKNIKYLSFFRYSYFNKGILSNFKDNNVDFSYLDGKKLSYPIISIGVNHKLIVFVPLKLLEDEDINKLGEKYISNSGFRVVKYGNFYIFEKNNVNFNSLFDVRSYIKALASLKDKFKIITLQIGQNPLSKIEIDDFSNWILWIEVVKYNKLKGLILDLFKDINHFYYSEDFYKDDSMVKRIISLYDRIINFYKMMGAVPQDLGSLFPNYLDITAFNPDRYKLKYSVIGPKNVKICFAPKSKEFKNLYWFEIENGYWCYNFKF